MYTDSSNHHKLLPRMHRKATGSRQRQQIHKNKKTLSLCYRTPFGSNRYGRVFLEDLILLNKDRIVKAPPVDQYTVQSTSEERKETHWKNGGSASLEATMILPLLLFAFWMFYSMGQIFIMENQIYQAVNNTADSMAEIAYLKQELEECSCTVKKQATENKR